MKTVTLICSLPLISACTLHASFIPESDTLHNAVVGQPYFAEIHITGGPVASLDRRGRETFVGKLTPTNNGLYLQHCDKNNPSNNCVQVAGTPTESGIAKIRLAGGLFGTNVAVGSGFDKTYTITIKQTD